MNEPTTQDHNAPLSDLIPFEIIRTETVLSKFPIHALAKRGKVEIHITRKNDQGEEEVKWEISYNTKYGIPRQLAYKIDTLIVNRRIDELDRPLPKIIKLGSLREIAAELGFTSTDTDKIKRAIKQDAGVFIDAKIEYRDRDGHSQQFELSGTRYNVVFTGKKLPDGNTADAVYLLLHDAYWHVLNNAPDRPLDYSYLKALAPSPQRLYEILSFRIFAALKYQQPRAKMLYSEYCVAAPQPRYYESDPVKKQMYKLHRPHRNSGYLAKVSYQPSLDSEGKPDWIIWYTPGPKALAEFKAFRKKTYTQGKHSVHDAGQGHAQNTPASEQKETGCLPSPQTAEDAVSEQAVALVRYFYLLFHKLQEATPQSKELEHAERLIREHGFEKAKYIVSFAHQAAPETNFVPVTFGGIVHYAARALAAFQQQRHSRQTAQAKAQQYQQEERQLQEERERRAKLAQRYHSFSSEEQARLQAQAKANLLEQGYKAELMFEAVVHSEIYRLMEAQKTSSI
jgi:hypothetical protein